MAGSFSDYLELALLDHLTGVATFTTPNTMWVELYTGWGGLTDAGGGTPVSGGAYARKAVAKGATNWATAAAGATSNKTAITFTTATANWGTVGAFGLFDAAAAGNLLGWSDLTTARKILSGDTATFAVGDLDLTLG